MKKLALLIVLAAWSDVVYPVQRLPLVFSHAKHAARGTQCAQCHPTAATSRSAVDNLIPTEAECRTCHAIDRNKPDAACAKCHAGYQPGGAVDRVYLTPPPLKFDHSAHKADCESCHPVRNVDLATTRELPTMTSCLSCHKDGAQERHCTDCHLAQLGGLIQTKFPHGDLVPVRSGLGDDHGPGFARDHKQQARQVGATCTACHSQSECVDCHQGVVKPMDFHPGNYLLAHVVDARRGRPDCSACHRFETFCVGCHEREGLGTRGNPGFDPVAPATRFHPPNWSSPQPDRTLNLHAQDARRNIGTCASCHREEDCTQCHSAEPGNMVKASPHPSGWSGSARCRALDRGNRRMCLRCHVTKDELGCDWKAR